MKIIFFLLLTFNISLAIAQERIRVPLNLMLMIKVPIQPNDTTWKKWNYIPNPKDSTQSILIDRRVQGFPAFIPRNDAPYYNEKQRNEIRLGFEKILNPDLYFQTEQAYMEFSHAFMEKYVFRKSASE